MTKTYSLQNLDCAACAAKMEEAAAKVPGVEKVRVNFLKKTMTLSAGKDDFAQVAQAVFTACGRVEPACRFREIQESGEHGHSHGPETDETRHALGRIGVGAVLFLVLLSVGWLLFETASLANGGLLILLACLCGGAMAGILGARPKKKRKR